ncbi:hypothetical protein DFH07DRAFT_826823 [Mycena maculata]|uniref:Uncharacterized protein n=1 Tax=Mycena maculata TaxID=230809 RepID=A0AAD7IYW4_9AGAR|nr:hypothetical protein DFH07DRAFT_826823 [Mycena maculata]
MPHTNQDIRYAHNLQVHLFLHELRQDAANSSSSPTAARLHHHHRSVLHDLFLNLRLHLRGNVGQELRRLLHHHCHHVPAAGRAPSAAASMRCHELLDRMCGNSTAHRLRVHVFDALRVRGAALLRVDLPVRIGRPLDGFVRDRRVRVVRVLGVLHRLVDTRCVLWVLARTLLRDVVRPFLMGGRVALGSCIAPNRITIRQERKVAHQ